MKNNSSIDINELWKELKNSSEKGNEMVSISEMVTNVISDIIQAREEKGLSQRALAESCGIKQSAIARMETLQAIPRIDTVAKISFYLGLHLGVAEKQSPTKYVFFNCASETNQQGTYDTSMANTSFGPQSQMVNEPIF
ncbi:MAG: helix-turn-helix transcriptional regulator [Bacteroidales bacterium]